jgi:NADH dehydrogenase (ubiquinone) 1 alpha subcomplex subunit 8
VYKDAPYVEVNPLPSTVPPVDELGTTSAPLKSASFFIGQHCKEVNGARQQMKHTEER